MLKKLLAACAGIVFCGSMALGGELDGVFSGKAGNDAMGVVIHNDGRAVRGTFDLGGEVRPIEGKVDDEGIIHGVWHAPDGMNVPFLAYVREKSLRIVMEDEQISLPRKTAEDVQPPVNPQPVERPVRRQRTVEVEREAGGDIVKMDRVPVERHQIFQTPVPPGWHYLGEGTNETYVVAPDMMTGIGFVGMEKIRPTTPVGFLKYIAGIYKVHEFKILSVKKVPYEVGELAEVTYTSTDSQGRLVKTWAKVATCDVLGAGAGYIWMASTYADQYDQTIDGLRSMAEKILIVDENAVFNRAPDYAQLKNRQLNHPLDSTYTDAYWSHQLTQEDAAKRDSEVRRGSFMMVDPETGNKYWVGHNAFRPDGTVPNPERPNENLVPPTYWQGHSLNG